MDGTQDLPFSEIVRLADLEVERRLKERERFYGLRKQSSKALRDAGHRVANGEVEERNTIPEIVEHQALRDFDLESAPYKNYEEYIQSASDRKADSNESGDGSVSEDPRANPDMVSEEAAFYKGAYFSKEIQTLFSEGQNQAASLILRRLPSILSPQQLDIYLLHTSNGLSFSEIAEKVGSDRRNIHTQWKRIEQKLKTAFKEIRGE